MIHRRLSSLAALPVVLIACQARPQGTVPAPEDAVVARLEALSADVQTLRALVTEGVLATSSLSTEVEAQLEGIGARMDAQSESTAKEWLISSGPFNVAMLLSGLPIEAASAHQGGTPVESATRTADDPGVEPADAAGASRRSVGDEDAIEVLSEALEVLREQRALLCENVANASVPGYKRREPTAFTMILEEDGLRIPWSYGSKPDMTPGRLDATRNPLDLAISGPGFFKLELPGGELRYSRGGRFRVGHNGRLCNEMSFPLSDDVVIPEGGTSIVIGADGVVYARGSSTAFESVGQITLHKFQNPDGLRAEGNGLYSPTVTSGQSMETKPDVFEGEMIRQGVIERSNVDLTDEVVRIQLMDRQIAAVRTLLAGYGIETP